MNRCVVLISGRGSNMEALLKAGLSTQIAAVISNVPTAKGLDIAMAHGVATDVVDHKAFPSREAFDRELAERVGCYQPSLVVLAGFMRILGAGFTDAFAGRMINIHPSLLPAFPGTHTHRRALEEGAKVHGCTVHFVTPELDRGPIIAQAAVPVLDDDTESSLAARVLAQEHRILPPVVRWCLEDRLQLDGLRVRTPSSSAPDQCLLSPLPG